MRVATDTKGALAERLQAALVGGLFVLCYLNSPSVAQVSPNPESPPISDDGALYLVRSTLIALQQANETGNYTVLRDLGSPSFSKANNATRLAEIFAVLRTSGVDISLAALREPSFHHPARLTDQGMLYLTGDVPSDAAPVTFELLFEPISRNWRLFGISVQPGGQHSKPTTNEFPASEMGAERPSDTEID